MSKLTNDEIIEAYGLRDNEETRHVLNRLRKTVMFKGGMTKKNIETLFMSEIEALKDDRPPDPFASATKFDIRQPQNTDGTASNEVWDNTHYEYFKAPYRFVPLTESIADVPSHEARLDTPLADGISADLSVTLAFDTPFLVEAGKSDGPLEIGGEGKWAIPGSTLRGWLRSTVEPLTFSRLSQIDHKRCFALRDFNHDVFRKFAQKSASPDLGHLQAGWLMIVKDSIVISPVRKWGLLPVQELIGSMAGVSETDWVRKNRDQRYKAAGAEDWCKPHTQRTAQKFEQIADPKSPGTVKYEAFRPANDQSSGEVFEGYVVVSDKMPGKGGRRAYEYAFFDPPNPDAAITIKPDELYAFESINPLPSSNRRNPNKPANAWDALERLARNGAAIPVFYTGDLEEQGEGFSFGLTKLYRLPHTYSLGDKGPQDYRIKRADDGTLFTDIADGLFGYVAEEHEMQPMEDGTPATAAHKGRIAIGFARPTETSTFVRWPDAPAKTIQGEPKPSYAPFYLVGPHKDWSDPTAKLAGRKRYVPRRDDENPDKAEQAISAMMKQQLTDYGPNPPDTVTTALQFLKPGGEGAFRFRIRCHNVSRFELGAVIWALTFGGDTRARHMIGRGKPFGAGQCRVTAIDGTIRTNAAPETEMPMAWGADGRDEAASDLMTTFETEMSTRIKTKWRDTGPVQAVLSLARPVGWSNAAFSYLPFGGNGKAFANLRKATGPRAQVNKDQKRAPFRLLGAKKS